MKILVTVSSFCQYSNAPIEKLKEAGIEFVTNPFGRKLTPEESFRLYASDIEGVIAGTEEISADLIKHASLLRVISRCGSGIDNINLSAAKEREISVLASKSSVIDAVAELTIGLMFDVLRGISRADRSIREGGWKRPMGYLLQNKTLGIVGVGRIGKRVIELCQGFHLKYLGYDIAKDFAFASKYQLQYKNIDEVLSQSDVISIHLPASTDSINFINAERLSLLRKCTILLNTSRGNIIDEKALYDSLRDNRIFGVALDVFEQEPYTGKLRELDNVLLTSHIGSYAREARSLMELEATVNLISELKMQRNRALK